MSAFKRAVAFLMEDAVKAITDPTHQRYTPLPNKYFLLECLEAHVRHIDAGVGGITVPVAVGEIIETRDLSIHSVDISKFRKLGVVYR